MRTGTGGMVTGKKVWVLVGVEQIFPETFEDVWGVFSTYEAADWAREMLYRTNEIFEVIGNGSQARVLDTPRTYPSDDGMAIFLEEHILNIGRVPKYAEDYGYVEVMQFHRGQCQ